MGTGRHVLFVCVQNAGRSQIAEALFVRAAGGRHEARSAGSHPAARVHPEVVEALRELGIDVARRVPHRLDRDDLDWADLVVTMGCGDECPVAPGVERLDWELDDPAGRGVDEARRIRAEIAARTTQLVETLDAAGTAAAR